MAAGSISKTEFKEIATNFTNLTKKTHELWKMTEIPESGQCYIHKKEVKKVTPKPVDKQPRDQVFTDEDNCEIFQSSDIFLTYDYHIVFSESYSVPVLYFNVYHQSGKLLSLDEVWFYIPENYKDRLLQDKWSFLTQQEHPILGRPFFMLHPCHTKDLMAQVTTIPDNKPSNYILSWLCAVGPVVGLQISTVYGKCEPD